MGKFKTIAELTEGEHKNIRYTTDAKAQAAYIDMSIQEGLKHYKDIDD